MRRWNAVPGVLHPSPRGAWRPQELCAVGQCLVKPDVCVFMDFQLTFAQSLARDLVREKHPGTEF